MVPRDPQLRALDHLLEALRHEPLPQLDLARLETSLLRQVEQQTNPLRPAWRLRVPWFSAGLALAVASALVWVGVAVVRAPTPLSSRGSTSAGGLGIVHGERLELGDWLQSGERELYVEHPGRAKWTLSPHSRARLVSQGDRLTVMLESGSLLAEIEPQSGAESFAVEVKQTRIAVHGTVFRVTVAPDRVKVMVQRGTVVVGSTSQHGRTEGFVLTAPMAGTFSLDGAKSGQIEGAPTSVTTGSTHESPRYRVAQTATPGPDASKDTELPSAVASGQAPASAEAEASALTDELPTPAREQTAAAAHARASASALPTTIAWPELEAALERVISGVDGCFTRHTVPRGDMLVSITFDMTTIFGPGGSVTAVVFDPPLLPTIEHCSREAAATIRVPASERGAIAHRRVTLPR